MSSSETMPMVNLPSEALSPKQGAITESDDHQDCQCGSHASAASPVMEGGGGSMGGDCSSSGPAIEAPGGQAGPGPAEAMAQMPPYYESMPQGSQSPQPGGPGPQAGMCAGGPQPQMPPQFGPMPMGQPSHPPSGPGPQAGMYPGGHQPQMPPQFGPMPMGPPTHQPGGPGPQAGMYPGGPQPQMPPQFGPMPMGPPTYQPGGPGPQAGMYPGGPQPQMPPQFGPMPMGQPSCRGHVMDHPGPHPQYAPAQGFPGGPGAGHFKHDENRHGQLFGIIQDLANGQPDVGRVMNWFESCDTQFWKGALVGAAAAMLVVNPTVKKTIVDAMSGFWGVFQKSGQEESPQVTTQD